MKSYGFFLIFYDPQDSENKQSYSEFSRVSFGDFFLSLHILRHLRYLSQKITNRVISVNPSEQPQGRGINISCLMHRKQDAKASVESMHLNVGAISHPQLVFR